MTLPNFITLLRLFLVPLVVWLIGANHLWYAFWAFVAAGVSDGVDGFIAKRFNLTSELGAHLDPIADKALLVSIYVALGFKGDIPPWLVITVVSRDVLIVGGVVLSWMLGRPVAMRPLIVSKANTLMQIVLASLVLGSLAFRIDIAGLIQAVVVLVAILTAVSALAYCIEWLRHMADGPSVPDAH